MTHLPMVYCWIDFRINLSTCNNWWASTQTLTQLMSWSTPTQYNHSNQISLYWLTSANSPKLTQMFKPMDLTSWILVPIVPGIYKSMGIWPNRRCMLTWNNLNRKHINPHSGHSISILCSMLLAYLSSLS